VVRQAPLIWSFVGLANAEGPISLELVDLDQTVMWACWRAETIRVVPIKSEHLPSDIIAENWTIGQFLTSDDQSDVEWFATYLSDHT
jgi:hypothetical protein